MHEMCLYYMNLLLNLFASCSVFIYLLIVDVHISVQYSYFLCVRVGGGGHVDYCLKEFECPCC